MSADTREQPMDRFGQLRQNFRVWRGQRPFWGGLLTMLAGIPIVYVPYRESDARVADASVWRRQPARDRSSSASCWWCSD